MKYLELYYSHGFCYSIELNVTVSVNYTPDPGEDPEKLGPNEFTAASSLILNCTVNGHSGGLTYAWSVTGNPDTPDCYRCHIDTFSTTSLLALGRPALSSYFAGVYMCNVSESGRPNSENSDDFTLTVVGMFMWILYLLYCVNVCHRCWVICWQENIIFHLCTWPHSQQ